KSCFRRTSKSLNATNRPVPFLILQIFANVVQIPGDDIFHKLIFAQGPGAFTIEGFNRDNIAATLLLGRPATGSKTVAICCWVSATTKNSEPSQRLRPCMPSKILDNDKRSPYVPGKILDKTISKRRIRRGQTFNRYLLASGLIDSLFTSRTATFCSTCRNFVVYSHNSPCSYI